MLCKVTINNKLFVILLNEGVTIYCSVPHSGQLFLGLYLVGFIPGSGLFPLQLAVRWPNL